MLARSAYQSSVHFKKRTGVRAPPASQVLRRGQDSNLQSSGHEPDESTNSSTPLAAAIGWQRYSVFETRISRGRQLHLRGSETDLAKAPFLSIRNSRSRKESVEAAPYLFLMGKHTFGAATPLLLFILWSQYRTPYPLAKLSDASSPLLWHGWYKLVGASKVEAR